MEGNRACQSTAEVVNFGVIDCGEEISLVTWWTLEKDPAHFIIKKFITVSAYQSIEPPINKNI